MKLQRLIIIITIVAVILVCSVTLVLLNSSPSSDIVSPNVPVEPDNPTSEEPTIPEDPETPEEPEVPDDPEPEPLTPLDYRYMILNTYPHDKTAFTQGLAFQDGVLYEGTGLYGSSSLRRVDLQTGTVIQNISLNASFFGEGITVFEDKIIQLTWKSKIGFVYNKTTFELLQTFNYSTQGWGITHNGSFLIMSDGTANLYFIEPDTFETVGQVEVFDNEPVTALNELEYINGYVYANVWTEDKIVIINPETGQVTGWIDLKGINDAEKTDIDAVLNGIAYDQNNDRLFVTGKMWSKLFEIKPILVD